MSGKTRSASKISLPGYESLFQPTEAEIAESGKGRIVEVSLEELHSFKNHPFQIRDDDEMQELVESVRLNGVLTPGTVRIRTEGGYELISGHRRKRAAFLAGLDKMPVIIKDYSDDEAVIAMTDANLQREHILPSEKAKAYKMKYEAIKHQGKNGGRSLQKMEDESGESKSSIKRFIKLNDLIAELLLCVDKGKLGIVPGSELAWLKPEEQNLVYEEILENNTRITKEQALKLKEYSLNGGLSSVAMALVLQGKKKDRSVLNIKKDRIAPYFNPDDSDEDIEDMLVHLLQKLRESGDLNELLNNR